MVARLQEQLGIDLLAIEGRKAKLTDHGKVLLLRAVEVLDDAQRLEQLASTLRKGWEPEITITVDAAFPIQVLRKALSRFVQLTPQTRVQLKEAVLSGADEALLQKAADLVIGTRIPTGFLGDLLLDVEFVAVAHPEHLLHRLGREITAEDLASELQIVLRDSGTQNPRDEGWLGATQRWTVTSMETSIGLVAEGLGFAWLPCHLVQSRIDAGTLKPLPLKEGQRRRVPLYLIFAQPDLAGPATRQLAEVVREAAEEHSSVAKM